MIKTECLSREWIEKIANSQKADKILVEKVIRALMLLEGLAESKLDFVFKGGTALMLLFESNRRLSIDIDIIIPDKEKDLNDILEKICKDKGFTRFNKQDRNSTTQIDKEHYKLFFQSEIEEKESYILLDVLKETIHYNNIIEVDINSIFVEQEGTPIVVKVPDFNNILGDKLTAFAPNTTGIPYFKKEKEMGMEIIKQMYDIGCLCDYADNIETISSVFTSFAETEIKYRNKDYSTSEVLEDIINNALEICLRGTQNLANYEILSKGVHQVKGFIFSESFNMERAIKYAAKVLYIASLIKHGKKEIKRYDPKYNEVMKDWHIQRPMNTKLEKIRKTDVEAFFYLYQVSEMNKEII